MYAAVAAYILRDATMYAAVEAYILWDATMYAAVEAYILRDATMYAAVAAYILRDATMYAVGREVMFTNENIAILLLSLAVSLETQGFAGALLKSMFTVQTMLR